MCLHLHLAPCVYQRLFYVRVKRYLRQCHLLWADTLPIWYYDMLQSMSVWTEFTVYRSECRFFASQFVFVLTRNASGIIEYFQCSNLYMNMLAWASIKCFWFVSVVCTQNAHNWNSLKSHWHQLNGILTESGVPDRFARNKLYSKENVLCRNISKKFMLFANKTQYVQTYRVTHMMNIVAAHQTPPPIFVWQ